MYTFNHQCYGVWAPQLAKGQISIITHGISIKMKW